MRKIGYLLTMTIAVCLATGLYGTAWSGGVAECLGCKVTVVHGVPFLTGTPRPPEGGLNGLVPELRIWITDRDLSYTEFVVFPGPNFFGNPMNISGMTMPPKPEGAMLTFVYWNLNFVERTDPPLAIPLIK